MKRYDILKILYVDMGTGAIVISSLKPLIIALIMAIGGVLVRIFWNPIKRFFKKERKCHQKYIKQ